MSRSEHFGWPSYYEGPEAYWNRWNEQQGAEDAARVEASFQRRYQAVLREAKNSGVMDAQLSYTRICELEWETGIASGSWRERYEHIQAAFTADCQLRAERSPSRRGKSWS